MGDWFVQGVFVRRSVVADHINLKHLAIEKGVAPEVVAILPEHLPEDQAELEVLQTKLAEALGDQNQLDQLWNLLGVALEGFVEAVFDVFEAVFGAEDVEEEDDVVTQTPKEAVTALCAPNEAVYGLAGSSVKGWFTDLTINAPAIVEAVVIGTMQVSATVKGKIYVPYDWEEPIFPDGSEIEVVVKSWVDLSSKDGWIDIHTPEDNAQWRDELLEIVVPGDFDMAGFEAQGAFENLYLTAVGKVDAVVLGQVVIWDAGVEGRLNLPYGAEAPDIVDGCNVSVRYLHMYDLHQKLYSSWGIGIKSPLSNRNWREAVLRVSKDDNYQLDESGFDASGFFDKLVVNASGEFSTVIVIGELTITANVRQLSGQVWIPYDMKMPFVPEGLKVRIVRKTWYELYDALADAEVFDRFWPTTEEAAKSYLQSRIRDDHEVFGDAKQDGHYWCEDLTIERGCQVENVQVVVVRNLNVHCIPEDKVTLVMYMPEDRVIEAMEEGASHSGIIVCGLSWLDLLAKTREFGLNY